MEMGPLSRDPRQELGVVLVESQWKAEQRPYHQQKLALLLSNQRHFALELARAGVAVRYLFSRGPYGDALRAAAEELGALSMMRPAERELRRELQPLVEEGVVTEEPHEGWLSTGEQFRRLKGPPWRMDAFYRQVRRERGVLVSRGKPVGGKWSFDASNRKPWRGEPEPPTPPTLEPDAITREVADLVEQRFGHHPGAVDRKSLPATRDDAERWWRWARRSCLPHFGPYEDAMSVASKGLFHTRIAPLINLHRLLPSEILEGALALDVPLPSKEGFVRQVLGWREFVHHVHEATDGFRDLAEAEPPRASAGDGGWSRWAAKDWTPPAPPAEGGARPNVLDARVALPPAFWGQTSGLRCLDEVVSDVWSEGWSHHITRLMVLSNVATLLDIDPRELTDWFWVAYIDAYDWVVEPNVLAMGTFATGELMTTKPYVSGAAYIHRMSDYCGECAFDPRSSCPLTRLYWAFLARKKSVLQGNPRMALPLRSLAKRDGDEKKRDAETFERVVAALAAGERLTPL